MAMLSHLLMLLTGFLGPLIIWLIKKGESAYVDHHGKESLNFQLTLLLISICLGAVGLVLMIVTFGLGMFLIMPIALVISILSLIWTIQACIAANSGKSYRYPFSIRFL